MAEFIISAFADEAQETLDGQIAALKRNGLSYIEPRNIGGKSLLAFSDDELSEIRRKLDENGISVYSYGSPIGKVEITADFDGYLKQFDRALRVCEILGAKRMRIFSFFVKEEEKQAYRGEVLRRMNSLLDRAEQAGITLCHENESLIYGQNPPEVRDLLSSLPRLRGVFDAANFLMNDGDPMEGFEATLPSLDYLHIKDCISAKKCMVPVGEGEGRYEEILRYLSEHSGERITLTVEPHLRVFYGYNAIDRHDLKTGRDFSNGDDAFDCAVSALKELLNKIGYREENRVWKR